MTPTPETVTIAKMTVNEVVIKVDNLLPYKYWTSEIAYAHFKGAVEVLQSLGLIKPEPPASNVSGLPAILKMFMARLFN